MPKKAKFEVLLEIPEGCSREDVASYIHDAVQCWKGSHHPNDAIFRLDYMTVEVRDPAERKRVFTDLEDGQDYIGSY